MEKSLSDSSSTYIRTNLISIQAFEETSEKTLFRFQISIQVQINVLAGRIIRNNKYTCPNYMEILTINLRLTITRLKKLFSPKRPDKKKLKEIKELK